MSVFKVNPPSPPATSWWRVSFATPAGNEPIATWYEIATDGKALRSIDVMASGELMPDAVDRYPHGVTPSGFGSLLGASFFDLDWAWPTSGEDDPISPLLARASEFEAVWTAALNADATRPSSSVDG